MSYYEVGTKCGHVGRMKYIEKTFAVRAESAKEAAARARYFPRVKHDWPDAITYVKEVDRSRFFELVNNFKADPFFQCRSIQDQRRLCSDLDVRDKYEDLGIDYWEKPQSAKFYAGKQLLRNPKKYMNNYYCREEDWAS